MFFSDHDRPESLKWDPLKAIVAPRPIGWITSLDADGRSNLAPYSFFNLVSSSPRIVMFASAGDKDSSKNARTSGEFVCSLATWDLRRDMHLSGNPLPPGEDEAAHFGIEMAPSRLVKPQRVAAAPAALECVTLKVDQLHDRGGDLTDAFVVYGQVVGIYIDDRYVAKGRFDMPSAHPIARCGYGDYASASSVFEIDHPDGRTGYPAPIPLLT